MRVLIFFAVFVLAAVAAIPAKSDRIVGGFQTVIEQYPFSASLLRHVSANNFRVRCGGTVVNNRSILTAGHCFENESSELWRMRVGSTNAHSGGAVHNINRVIMHPNYHRPSLDSDIAILRSSSAFVFGNSVRPGSIAGANYNVADNVPVWAIGWGAVGYNGPSVEQLRHVQVFTVNQATCRSRYSVLSFAITDNMLCSGMLDVGGRGQCQGDSGSPVLHGNVIVGVTSWGVLCAQPVYPSVNVRVSRFASWIQSNS